MQTQSPDQICSYALTLLKRPPIADITADTPDAIACNAIFPLLRDELLSLYAWTFSVKRQHLMRLSTPPVNQYLSAHQIPEDCLYPLELRGCLAPYITPSGVDDTGGFWPPAGWGWDSDISFTWIVEGDAILSNAGHLYLKYVSQVTETGLFSSLFAMSLAYRIAATLAYSTTGNEKLAATLMQMSDLKASQGRGKDAQIGTQEPMPQPDSWLLSRGASYSFRGTWGSGYIQGPTE